MDALKDFTILPQSRGRSIFELLIHHDGFRIRYSLVEDRGLSELWALRIDLPNMPPTLNEQIFYDFPYDEVAQYGEQFLGHGALESSLWAADFSDALAPYIKDVRSTVAASTDEARARRWQKALYRIKMRQS